ncbi:MAG: protein kinase domain-containing protein, partial [Planctomycetota bacterium]
MKTTDRERDQQVIDALDEYLAAQHAGRPIPRAEFLGRHRELAEDLERYLANLDLVMGEEDVEGEQPNRIIGGTLGDFLIRREIGRGGMGVVYEAEQISLARRVALKVLPFAAVFDERQLQRFKNEAQAAALLHHPHIVPVYAVGQERGVHYYAMQYIEGRSLAQIVDELQHEPAQPSQPLSVITKGKSTRSAEYCRGVARIGIQVADALALAHERGVVHRDVKPGNLMVDPLGHLWVTDFGLAVFQQGDTNLTMTGDLLGTVRYMSPEQVRGNRGAIDHRTDIYSLGATLYELLTLEVAFPGESPQRVMQQIADEDPPPPRTLNPSVPIDLETIVLKAMEKEPGARYAHAAEFAADLDAFLANRPVEARRPSTIDKTAKWARRHRPLVFAAFATLVAATTALAISVWSIAREQEISEGNRLRAERGLGLAEDAIEEMLAEVGAADLLGVPRMVPVRRRLLQKALAYYERLIEERPDDPGLVFQHAIARKRIGDIEALLGHIDNAERAYDQAAAAFEQCGDAARPRLRNLAWNRAKLSLRTGRLAAALESLDRAEALGGEVEIQQAWIDAARGNVLFEQGEDKRARRCVESARSAAERIEAAATLRAYCSRTLGLIRSVSGDWQRAEAAFRQALEEQDSPGVDRAEIENSRLQLGSALRKLGRIEEAEQIQRAAAKWRAEVAKSFPSVPALAGAAADEAAQLFETRSWDWESPGIASLEGSVAQLARLAREFPAEPAYKSQWADALTNQADAQGKPEEHLDLLTRALELRRELARDFPEPLRHRWNLAAALTNQIEDPKALQEGIFRWKELVQAYPNRAHLKEGWADGLNNLSVTKTGTGAEAILRRAIELYTDLAARNPAVVSYPQKLSTTYRSLAVVLQHYDVDAAVEAVEQAVHWSRGVSREHPDVATYLHLHAYTIGQLGAFLIALDRPGVEEALTEA